MPQEDWAKAMHQQGHEEEQRNSKALPHLDTSCATASASFSVDPKRLWIWACIKHSPEDHSAVERASSTALLDGTRILQEPSGCRMHESVLGSAHQSRTWVSMMCLLWLLQYACSSKGSRRSDINFTIISYLKANTHSKRRDANTYPAEGRH